MSSVKAYDTNGTELVCSITAEEYKRLREETEAVHVVQPQVRTGGGDS